MKKLLIIAASIALLMTGCNEESPLIVKDKDGNVYKTIKIGEQVWMAQNLNVQTENSWCYDDDPANCETYGRLYAWSVAKSVCPEGWHLPNKDEYETLINFVGGVSTAGKVLKSKSGWHSRDNDKELSAAVDSLFKSMGFGSTANKEQKSKAVLDTNGNGTDDFGFSALPAGYRFYQENYFNYIGWTSFAVFWCSMDDNSGDAYNMRLQNIADSAYMDLCNKDCIKDLALSVRCVKDAK